jgi:hypothetical protein
MPESPQEKKVHDLRRHVKRLRALARLLEQLGARNARDVNECLGSLGRELSDERDLTVKNKWLRKNGFPELTKAPPRRSALGPLPASVVKEEKKLRHEAELISLDPSRIEAALRATARRARAARKLAKKKQRDDDFHRWRKRVRDLVEQSKLLGLPEEEGLQRLVKELGKAQDTVVVREGLRKLPGAKKAVRAAKQEGQRRWKKALKEKPKPELAVAAENLRALNRFLHPGKRKPAAA